MNRVAIVVWTEYGQTLKIAHEIGSTLERQGIGIQILNLRWGLRPDFDLNAFDSFLIGAPIYAGKFNAGLLQWVSNNLPILNAHRTGFFSVSLNAASEKPEARATDDKMLKQFCSETGLIPQFLASIAGALHYRKYGFFLRWMMRKISKGNGGPTDTSKDYEMTRWPEVAAFVQAFVANDLDSRFAYHNRLGQAATSAQAPGLTNQVPKTLPS